MTLLLLLEGYGVYTRPTVEQPNLVDKPRVVYNSTGDIGTAELVDTPQMTYSGQAA
jgi:hypothetical protein